MYEISTNAKGSRQMDIADSIIDEMVLENCGST